MLKLIKINQEERTFSHILKERIRYIQYLQRFLPCFLYIFRIGFLFFHVLFYIFL